MVGDGWDCCMRSTTVTTTCSSVMGGVKVGFALDAYVSHQDWVILNLLGQFTASQPFKHFIVSTLDGFARLRFELIIHNHHQSPAFKSWMATRLAPVPYFSHQDGVCLDWFKNITASQPFQHLTISIINGWRWLRLLYEVQNGHHNVFFSHGWGQSWLGPCPLFTPRLSEFELIWAVHCISSLPMSHCKYNESLYKVEIWIHLSQ